jgi:GntR family transcriptional regulator
LRLVIARIATEMSLASRSSRRMPPYRRVADDLRAKIDAGELLPGEQVPSMAQLAESYGISRGTARRVLTTLRDEGYVYVTPGWGTFVVDVPPVVPGAP